MSTLTNFWCNRRAALPKALVLVVLAIMLGGAVFRDHRPATSQINLKTIYYPIQGSSVAELRASMQRAGPIDENGRRRDAHVGWKVNWRWPLMHGKPNYALTKVNAEVTVTLPSWEAPENAPAALRSAWSRFLLAIMLHENNHIRHVTQKYHSINSAILAALRGNPQLDQRAAHEAAYKVIARMRSLDRSYDQSTAHGRSEGVCLPCDN